MFASSNRRVKQHVQSENHPRITQESLKITQESLKITQESFKNPSRITYPPPKTPLSQRASKKANAELLSAKGIALSGVPVSSRPQGRWVEEGGFFFCLFFFFFFFFWCVCVCVSFLVFMCFFGFNKVFDVFFGFLWVFIGF